ncbi:MAG: hypothetical protein WC312_03930 [Candidatus Omnitrophota bacterium]|jgi:UDP-2,3-diacylglucosamine pyrophosphatase LpxH
MTEIKEQVREVLESYLNYVMTGDGFGFYNQDQSLSQIHSLYMKWVEEIIKIDEDYIALLKEELDEVVSIAYIHGWKSSRIKEGEEARKAIAEIKARIEKER